MGGLGRRWGQISGARRKREPEPGGFSVHRFPARFLAAAGFGPEEVSHLSTHITALICSTSERIVQADSCRKRPPVGTEGPNVHVRDPSGVRETGVMTDFVNTVMLIAASVGALAFGVLAAYGVLRAAFTLMRPQRLGGAVEAGVRVAEV